MQYNLLMLLQVIREFTQNLFAFFLLKGGLRLGRGKVCTDPKLEQIELCTCEKGYLCHVMERMQDSTSKGGQIQNKIDLMEIL